ncbi:chromatin-remodeling complex subunit ies6 [Ceratobasidium sp. 370]|nr:chromatin-remodeling complex subunit ies6 [Ceratobasidium sp. 370]
MVVVGAGKGAKAQKAAVLVDGHHPKQCRPKVENENQLRPPHSSLLRPNHQYVDASPHNLLCLTAPKSLVESLSYAHYPRPFKNPAYTKNTNRRAKSAKQVLGAEREREKLGREKAKPQGMDVDWAEDPDAMTFTSIEAPPSVLPQKRYCDITGLEGPYTDPASGLRYHDKSIYELIKSLAILQNPASMQAYRSVRNSHSVVK